MSDLVVIESPLMGDLVRNQVYARWCMLDSFRRGEQPFASHLLYTQVLDDENAEDRKLGIKTGLAWAKAAGARHVFYVDMCRRWTQAYPDSENADGYVLTPSMSLAWSKGGGEVRLLTERSPHFWERFQRGESPKKTRGAA